MDAVDTWIKTPERKADQPFLMPIEDVFTITGRGTVTTGRVERGRVKVGDKVEIVGHQGRHQGDPSSPAPRCSTRPSSTPRLATTSAALLRGIAKKDVERGQVLAAPKSIQAPTPSSRARCTS